MGVGQAVGLGVNAVKYTGARCTLFILFLINLLKYSMCVSMCVEVFWFEQFYGRKIYAEFFLILVFYVNFFLSEKHNLIFFLVLKLRTAINQRVLR